MSKKLNKKKPLKKKVSKSKVSQKKLAKKLTKKSSLKKNGNYRRTKNRDKRFFNCLETTGRVGESARYSGYSRTSVYQYRLDDAEFAEQWQASLDTYTESLEAEADRRAVNGIDEPVFYKGEMIATKKKYSDNLLMFRLKGISPDKYRERREVKHDGKIESAAPVINLTLSGDGKVEE